MSARTARSEIAQTAADDTGIARPKLVFFYATTSGRCRRTEGHLAQALQRRHNHDTFELVRVDINKRPDLAEHLRVEEVPTLLVVEGRRVVCRIVSPRGSRQLRRELARWLR